MTLQSAADSSASERAGFIRRTYGHLAIAILGFIAVEYYLVHSPFAAKLASSMTSGMSWLIVLGLFMGVSYIANRLALSQTSQQMQYLGLGLFVIAEAIVFLPLLYIATFYAGDGVIGTAGLMTLLLAGGITATVFITKKRLFIYGKYFNHRRFCCSWFYSLQYDSWIFTRISIRFRNGFICGRFRSLFHIKCVASISD